LSSIGYYITGHGYGHAVRSNLVIQALLHAAPGLKIYVRTTAPQWLFHGHAPVVYSSQAIDAGILQRDSLEMDLKETLHACRALHAKIPLLIKEEIEFIKKHGIHLIVGDIPPIAFEIAARAAFREGMVKAGPKLLEPVMKVEVVTPRDYMGDVIGDLNSRRGRITGQDQRGNAEVINAMVPLANMFGYVNTLRSMSQGRAQYTMHFDHYEQVPQAVADEVRAKMA